MCSTLHSTQNYKAYYTKLQCILCLITSELQIVLHNITLQYVSFLIPTVLKSSLQSINMKCVSQKTYNDLTETIHNLAMVR